MDERQREAGMKYMQSEIDTAIKLLSPLFPITPAKLVGMDKPQFRFKDATSSLEKLHPDGLNPEYTEVWMDTSGINGYRVGRLAGKWLYDKSNPYIRIGAKRRMDAASGKPDEFDSAYNFNLISGQCVGVVGDYCGFHYNQKKATFPEDLQRKLESILVSSDQSSNGFLRPFVTGIVGSQTLTMKIAEALFQKCDTERFRKLVDHPAEQFIEAVKLITGIDPMEDITYDMDEK